MKCTHAVGGRTWWSVAVLAAVAMSAPAAAQSPPPDVRAAAEQGLGNFLRTSQARSLANPAFGGGAPEVTGATVGNGFQIFTVPSDRLLNTTETDLRVLAVPTSLWEFLVVGADGPRGVLTVDRVNGTWTAVSLGAAGLAEQLTALADAWPASTYQMRFIRVYQASAELMEITQAGRVIGVVPFVSARVALESSPAFDPNDVWSPADVVSKLRPIVKRTLGRQ